jgi:predicted ATPase
MTATLPTGTVTFLFTDIEGSTRLLHELGERYAEVLAEHRHVLREAFARRDGVEVDTQGDAFFVAFARASDAVAAASEAQAALGDGPVRVRMGLHTGEPTVTEEGYVGIDVHRAARIAAAGHGGQVLLSQATRDLASAEFKDLGDHRLKDLSAPERIFQLGAVEFPRLNTLYQTNLPVQPGPLIGRERELAEVMAFLRDGVRLVTLTGAGGSGKTRLALHAAAELAEEFRDGVWFVPLASAADPATIEPAITAAAGAGFRRKDVLLVLDNLEHLLPDAADVVAELPVRVLATSRERLALGHEQEYEVPPLPEDDAVSLFAARARRLLPAFEPDEHVGAIVRRLDGLPLAVELAAARVKVLTPEQMSNRLDHSLDLLTAGARDAPGRQRTLRATIQWSYGLLAEEERRVLRALAVFRGSFTAAAAEDVAQTDLETVASLVDRSLVRRTHAGRLFLLETIRDFSLSQPSGGEEDEARARHAAYYERLLPEGVAGFDAVSRQMLELAPEVDNVRAAVEWVLDEANAERALDVAARATSIWEKRGFTDEAADWLRRALTLSDAVTPARVDALTQAQGMAQETGDFVRAVHAGEEAVAAARRLGESERLSAALTRLASAYHEVGDLQAARAAYEEALRLTPGRQITLKDYGELEMVFGNYERAQELLDDAVLAENVADRVRVTGLHSLADLALRRGDPDRARALYAESLALAVAFGLHIPEVYCAGGAAAAAALGNDRRAAARLWGAFERLEDEWGPIRTFERPYYEGVVGDVAADPQYIDARRLSAADALRAVEAYVHSP